MTPKTVTPDFAVAGQLRPEDLTALGGRFSMIINNRPDGEEAGQPAEAEMAAAAAAAGMSYRFIPVSGAPTPEQVGAMRAALEEAGGPTLAFCRTGTRSIVTWAVTEALEGTPPDALVAQGAAAGYDLGPPLQALLPRFGA